MKRALIIPMLLLLLLTACTDDGYVASSERAPFHRRSCEWAQKINGENLQTFKTRDAAMAAGHRPCKKCRP